MNTMKNKKNGSLISGLISLMLLLTVNSCSIFGVKSRDQAIIQSVSGQLRSIRKFYQSVDCFSADFKIKVVDAKSKVSRVNGFLRADNKNNRMRLRITVPFIGITVSEITIASEMVYINNPLAKQKLKKQIIPIKKFELKGLGHNNMPLPFQLFQDLLYARLPYRLFSRHAKLKKKGELLEVAFKKEGAIYRYKFINQKLRSVKYTGPGATGNQIEAIIDGNFEKSKFPETLILYMNPGKRDVERMDIDFNDLNLNASCKDSHFSIPRKVQP